MSLAEMRFSHLEDQSRLEGDGGCFVNPGGGGVTVQHAFSIHQHVQSSWESRQSENAPLNGPSEHFWGVLPCSRAP